MRESRGKPDPVGVAERMAARLPARPVLVAPAGADRYVDLDVDEKDWTPELFARLVSGLPVADPVVAGLREVRGLLASIDPDDIERDEGGRFAPKGGGGSGGGAAAIVDRASAWGDRAEEIREKMAGPDVEGMLRDSLSSLDGTAEGQAVAEHIWGQESFGPGGAYSVTVDTTEVFNGAFTATGSIEKDGEPVGDWSREIRVEADGTLVAEHSYLAIDDKFQGLGLAREFNRSAENAYIAADVDRIELHANIDVGGFAWASAGYDWDLSKGTGDLLQMSVEMGASTWASQFEGERQREWLALADRLYEAAAAGDLGSMPLPSDLAGFGRTEGAESWPGKEFMLSQSWYGVRELRPPE